jgi:hypothetical protein
MGADYHAYAAIGVLVDRTDLYQTKMVKVGNHDFDQKTLYHPQTGKQLWEPIPGFSDRTLMFASRFPVIMGTAAYTELYEQTIVICAIAPVRADETCDRMMALDLENLPQAKNDLKEVLEPIGLWDEQKFGLHAVLVCSY